MPFKNKKPYLSLLLALVLLQAAPALRARAQVNNAPITSQELVRLVYQLPGHPEKRDEIIEEIRRRGIGFQLTEGIRSVVANKSGNDVLLRRTLEEADRRRANPVTAAPPSAAEAEAVLTGARQAVLGAAQGIPDFQVRQLITRSIAREQTRNWRVQDRLTVAVTYRESSGGEQYRLLAVNGLPEAADESEKSSYDQAGGSTTTGEFASLQLKLFDPESETEFKAVDTDTLRGRRTVVYEFSIKKSKARSRLTYGRKGEGELTTTAGLRGRVWVDRELFRVLRAEYVTAEVDPGFPIRQVENSINYDWVTINDKKYLMPVDADVIMTTTAPVTYYDTRREMKVTEVQTYQTRNEIRFRGYQKFGAEVKIIEDIGEDEPEEKKPQ